MSPEQRAIFDEIKFFVLEHRGHLSQAQLRSARLQMPNTFPARDRTFITDLAKDLHLELAWDEYDDDDQNLVTLRFPGSLEEPLPENEEVEDDNDEEWEEVDEGKAAVDTME